MDRVIMKKLCWVMKHDIIKKIFKSFLNDYQKEEIVLRKGSDFLFENVDLLSYSFHKIS